ncbi:MAG: 23S rRNA (adenine(2503)-C(2))-methyltransferase RlmN [Ignavibacteriaceae bacterium]|nr:23S rRNA (adenine(2503)-C(2))-methyltransferase RlmN [Ignavibacteriaceae bacterium]
MNKNKTQLKGLTLEELQALFLEMGEAKFRALQVFNWMYNYRVTSFDKMENLSKPLRNKLKENYSLITLNFAASETSTSGTKKLVFETAEGNKIESVIIPDEKRNTLCISTQVGCPLDCKFCATGLMGYKKNLSAGEIFDQYLLAQQHSERDISNIVYMGMGEPLLNYNATVNSLKIFSEELTKGISLKKITVSTAGIAPKIIELADSGLKAKLALSLHSCFEKTRSKIMPINEKYPLKDNLEAVAHYAKKTKTRITFEYIMLKGLNDRDEDIKALIKLTSQIPSKINVIPFNSLQHMHPTGFSASLLPTEKKRIDDFVQILRDNNVTVMVRETQGDDIAAACGQLAVKFK